MQDSPKTKLAEIGAASHRVGLCGASLRSGLVFFKTKPIPDKKTRLNPSNP